MTRTTFLCALPFLLYGKHCGLAGEEGAGEQLQLVVLR